MTSDEWTSSSGATITADESETVTGGHSLRVERESADRATIGYSFPFSLDLEGKHFSMAVKVESPAGGRIEARIRSPTNDDRSFEPGNCHPI